MPENSLSYKWNRYNYLSLNIISSVVNNLVSVFSLCAIAIHSTIYILISAKPPRHYFGVNKTAIL
jgi:hypothetical protein